MISEFGSGRRTYGDLNFVTTNTKNTVKGLQFPLNVSNTGGMFARNTDIEAIKDGLIQLIMTQNGERPMNYAYGTNVRGAVFEPLDAATIDGITTSIDTAIRRFEPRIMIKSLRVVENVQESGVDIGLTYAMRDGVFSVQTLKLTVNSQGGRVNV